MNPLRIVAWSIVLFWIAAIFGLLAYLLGWAAALATLIGVFVFIALIGSAVLLALIWEG